MPRPTFSAFDWDDGNREKCQKHGVSIGDIEHVLAHAETMIASDESHSQSEPRMLAIGRTLQGRYAFVVFTPRQRGKELRLRPISARFMHATEVKKYEKEITRAPKR